MPEKSNKYRTWKWVFKIDLKNGTEALLRAVQKQPIRRNYVKHYIDKTSEEPLCRLCGEKVKVCNT